MSDYRILKTGAGIVEKLDDESTRMTIGLPGVGKIVSEIILAAQNVRDATPAMRDAVRTAPEVFNAGTSPTQTNAVPTRANNVVHISGPTAPAPAPRG